MRAVEVSIRQALRIAFAMTGTALENLLKMLAAGRDNALLRFSLGNEYVKSGEPAAAVEHLRKALEHDPAYSAAWKLLGKALEESGALHDALAAFRRRRAPASPEQAASTGSGRSAGSAA